MDERRFIKLLWLIKASLVAILLYAGFEAASSRLHLGHVLVPDKVSGEQPAAQPTAASPAEMPTDYSAIVRRNLFAGGSGPETDLLNSPAVDAMPSAEDLGLRLIGAVAGGPVASRAIIENTKDKTIGPYRIGDRVASATVESIQRDAVILKYEGRHFALRLQTATGDHESGAGENGTRDRKESSSQSSRPSPLSTRAGYVEEVFRQVQIEPYVENQQTTGLRLSGLDKTPLAGLIGLKDGDVIQTINGQQLTSKQKAFQVLMKAKTQSRVNIQLLRDGKSKDLSLPM